MKSDSNQPLRVFSLRVFASYAYWAGILCAFATHSSATAQARFKPAEDAVLLKTSVHAASAKSASFSSTERAWRSQPQDLQAALAYARAVFMLGLTEGDLRWFGSAKAALKPWWEDSDLPADGYFLRGLVKQGFHDFRGGLSDIDAAILRERPRPEFWSWRFALNLLLSQMDAARADCKEVELLFGPEESDPCHAILYYRTGQPEQALDLLGKTLRLARFKDGPSQDWLRFHLGEAYRTAGQPAQAIAAWEQHLKSRPESHLVRLALVELLNQQGQWQKAKTYAATDAPTDALLMQSLLASKGLQDGQTSALAARFEARMNAQALRRESLIERPRLIYLIRHGRDLPAGLALSIDNWKLQNEPADAVLFAEAALALNQPRAAEPVVLWSEKTGYTDPQLKPLVQALKAHPAWIKAKQ